MDWSDVGTVVDESSDDWNAVGTVVEDPGYEAPVAKRQPAPDLTPAEKSARYKESVTDTQKFLRDYKGHDPFIDTADWITGRLPVLGSIQGFLRDHEYAAAKKRIDAGEFGQEDVGIVAKHLNDQEDAQNRTWYQDVGEVVSHIPAFAVEMMATGGLAGGGEAIATRALGGALSGTATRAARAVASTAARTAASPHLLLEAAAQREAQYGESLPEALAKAPLTVAPELFTESYGGKLINKVASQLPGAAGLKRAQDAVAAAWLKRFPNRTVNDLLAKVAKEGSWDGPIGEVGEEWINDAIKGVAGEATGIQGLDFGTRGNMFAGIRGQFTGDKEDLERGRKGWYQQTVEAGAMSIPSAVRLGASAAGSMVSPKQTDSETIDTNRIAEQLTQQINAPAPVKKGPPPTLRPQDAADWSAAHPDEASALAALWQDNQGQLTREDWASVGLAQIKDVDMSAKQRKAFAKAVTQHLTKPQVPPAPAVSLPPGSSPGSDLEAPQTGEGDAPTVQTPVLPTVPTSTTESQVILDGSQAELRQAERQAADEAAQERQRVLDDLPEAPYSPPGQRMTAAEAREAARAEEQAGRRPLPTAVPARMPPVPAALDAELSAGTTRGIDAAAGEQDVPSTAAVSEPATVPFMITGEMRQRLRDMNYTRSQIDAMTPQEANELITKDTANAIDQPQTETDDASRSAQSEVREESRSAAVGGEGVQPGRSAEGVRGAAEQAPKVGLPTKVTPQASRPVETAAASLVDDAASLLPQAESVTPEQQASRKHLEAVLDKQRTLIRAEGFEPIDAHYEVRELGDIVASHDYSDGIGTSNAAKGKYPATLQPRDYGPQSDNDTKVRKHAARFDPRAVLNDSGDAASGSPTVTQDGITLNGNGRVMTIQLVKSSNPEAYAKYRAAVRERAAQVGIDPATVDGMTDPVLVRVVPYSSDSAEAKAFAEAGNISETQEQSPAETARKLSSVMDVDLLSKISLPDDATFSEAVNSETAGARRFREVLRSAIPATQTARYFHPDGKLTEGGKELVRNTLLQQVASIEVLDKLSPRQMQMLDAGIVQLLKLKRDFNDADVSVPLVNAMGFITRNDVRNDADVAKTLAQKTMFGGQETLTPADRMMVEFLLDNGSKPTSLRAASKSLIGQFEPSGAKLFEPPADERSTPEKIADTFKVQLREGAAFTKGTPDVAGTPQKHAAVAAGNEPVRKSAQPAAEAAKEVRDSEAGGKPAKPQVAAGTDGEAEAVAKPSKKPRKPKAKEAARPKLDALEKLARRKLQQMPEARQWYRDNLLESLSSWQNKGTPQQLKAHLAKTKGTKEYGEWIGLDDFLAGKDSVSKADVEAFVRANQVTVQEVTKGEPPSREQVIELAYNDMREVLGSRPGGITPPTERALETWLQTDGDNEWATSIIDEAFEEAGESIDVDDMLRQAERHFGSASGTRTKFSQWQTPGGSNYRELLLTLPQATAQYDDEIRSLSQWPANVYLAKDEKDQPRLDALLKAWDAADAEHPDFRSSHFDEPNVVVHVRMNDRVDANGKKTLFIEEIQSDWGQKGRKSGYESERPKFQAYYKTPAGELVGIGYGDTAEEAVNSVDPGWIPVLKGMNAPIQTRVDRMVKTGGVPNMPFKQSWPMLAFKRMIQFAAENGYEQIAWTTGEMQAARYDLSTQVDWLEYIHPDDSKTGEGVLKAYKSEGGESSREVLKETVAPDKLEDYIGKEAAKQILSEKPDKYGTRILEGDALKVGGKGMTGFYDRILPAEVNKHVKQWGAKVGTTELDTKTKGERFAEQTVAGAKTTPLLTVHALPIPDVMRESVTTNGQMLFQKPEPTPKNVAEAIKDAAVEHVEETGEKQFDGFVAELADRLGADFALAHDTAIQQAWDSLGGSHQVDAARPVSDVIEPQPASERMEYSVENLKTAFNLSQEEAEAVDAIVQETGIDTTKILLQQGGLSEPRAKGEFVWLAEAGKALVRGSQMADVSTALHEIVGHVVRQTLLNRDVPADQRAGITDADIAVAERWSGVKNGVWNTDAEERFANGLERFLRDGSTSNSRIKRVFAKVAKWMGDIYRKIKGTRLGLQISPEMKAVYEKIVNRKAILEKLAKDATAQAYTPQYKAAQTANAARKKLLKANEKDQLEAAEKTPWLFRQDEYDELFIDKATSHPDEFRDKHRAAVQQAKLMGEAIPDAVLNDYPELKDSFEDRAMDSPTALAMRVADQERVKLGLPPALPSIKQEFPDLWAAVLLATKDDPSLIDRTVDELRASPRPASAYEALILLYAKLQNQNEMADLSRRMEKAAEEGNESLWATLKQRAEGALDKHADLLDVIKANGAEAGRSLAVYRQLAKEDYTLAGMLLRAREANDGDMPEEVRKEVEELQKQLEAAMKENERLADLLEKQQIAEGIADAVPHAKAKGAKAGSKKATAPKGRPAAESAKAEVLRDLEQALANAKSAGLFQLDAAASPQDQLSSAFAALAQLYASEGVTDGRTFAQRVQRSRLLGKDFKTLKPKLMDAWRAYRLNNPITAAVKEFNPANVHEVNDVVDKLVYELVESGITERAPLVTAVLESLSPYMPGLTETRVEQMIAHYGQYQRLNRDDTRDKVRQLKGQLLALSKLKVAKSGAMPLKTGQERNKPDAEEQNLNKQLYEILKQGGLNQADPELELTTHLQTQKNHLENLMTEMEQELYPKDENGKPLPPKQRERSPVSDKTDAELEALRADYKALREIYRQVFQKPKKARAELTPQQKAARLEKYYDGLIERREKELADLQAGGSPKAKPDPIRNASLDQQRAKLKELSEARTALLEARDPWASRRRGLEKSLAYWESKLAKSDFAPQPKKVRDPLSEELEANQRKVLELKKLFATKLKLWQKEHAGPLVKALNLAYDIFHLPKDLTTTLDMGFGLIQAGAFHFAHPKLAAQADWATREVLKTLGDPAALTRLNQQITQMTHYKNGNFKRAGWDFSVESEEQTRMEELLLSNLSKKIPGLNQLIIRNANMGNAVLNMIRASYLTAMFESATMDAGSPTDAEARAIGSAVDIWTGRGDLGKYRQALTTGGGLLLFAPQWLASRLQSAVGWEIWQAAIKTGLTSRVTRLVAMEKFWQTSGLFVATAGLVMIYNALRPDDEEEAYLVVDPTDKDFGRIILDGGKTKIALSADPAIFGFLWRLAWGKEKVGGERGKVLGVLPARVGGEEVAVDRKKALGQFAYQKSSIPLKAFLDQGTTNIAGEGFTLNPLGMNKDNWTQWFGSIADRTTPMFGWTAYNVWKDQELSIAAKALGIPLAFIGGQVGVGNRKPELVKLKTDAYAYDAMKTLYDGAVKAGQQETAERAMRKMTETYLAHKVMSGLEDLTSEQSKLLETTHRTTEQNKRLIEVNTQIDKSATDFAKTQTLPDNVKNSLVLSASSRKSNDPTTRDEDEISGVKDFDVTLSRELLMKKLYPDPVARMAALVNAYEQQYDKVVINPRDTASEGEAKIRKRQETLLKRASRLGIPDEVFYNGMKYDTTDAETHDAWKSKRRDDSGDKEHKPRQRLEGLEKMLSR